jgi:predicted permease
MRDWVQYVREHLSLPDLEASSEDKSIKEIASQFEDVYQEHVSSGVTESEADARAREHVTDWDQLKAELLAAERVHREPSIDKWLEHHEQVARRRGSGWILLGDFWQDLRYALRTFRKSPAFLLVAVATLALGIGANVAIFSVLKTVLLRPLPFPEPDRLVMIWHANAGDSSTFPLSGPDYHDWKEQTTSFEDMGAFTVGRINLSGDSNPVRLPAVYCTSGLLKALAVEPVMGRFFSQEEQETGKQVALLSHALWMDRHGADPEIVGRSIRISGDSYSVIGIMPKDYEFPNRWNEAQQPALWLPLNVPRDKPGRNSNWLHGHGRLRDGITLEQAEKDLQRIAARLAQDYPDTNTNTTARLIPLHKGLVSGVSQSLWVLMGSVGLLLLIACANVASLLLARSSSRQSEVAIRSSMGAGQGRLTRQLLTESLVLCALGGSSGVLLAAWGISILRTAIPNDVPRIASLQIDESVLLFSLCVTMLTGIIFGLLPAYSRSRVDPVQALQEGGRNRDAGRRRARFMGGLVVVQVALSLVLANCAMLMWKSYLNVTDSRELVEPERMLAAGISLQGPAYENQDSQTTFWEQFQERLEALPGVESVGAATGLPLNNFSNAGVLVDDEPFDPKANGRVASVNWVTPDYFQAVGIPLLEGRTLQKQDGMGKPTGVVVNRILANRFWPGQSALGRRIRGRSSTPWFEAVVVGVVDDVRQWGLELPLQAEIFFPFDLNTWEERFLVVRSDIDPMMLVPLIRQELASIDKDVAMSAVRTGVDLYDQSSARRRFRTWLFALFALLALILVATGIYGVLSYHVVERLHEIGIRRALGAETPRVLMWILSRGLRFCLLGVVVGLAGALATSRIIESMLFQISPTHPLSFFGVGLALTLIVLAASLIPALRATSVDPVTVLRSE